MYLSLESPSLGNTVQALSRLGQVRLFRYHLTPVWSITNNTWHKVTCEWKQQQGLTPEKSVTWHKRLNIIHKAHPHIWFMVKQTNSVQVKWWSVVQFRSQHFAFGWLYLHVLLLLLLPWARRRGAAVKGRGRVGMGGRGGAGRGGLLGSALLFMWFINRVL